MIILELTKKTANRLRSLRKRLNHTSDNRTMIPVHDIIIDGCRTYDSDKELFTDIVTYYRSTAPKDLTKATFRRIHFNKEGWEQFHTFTSLTGLTDDGAMNVLIDCLGYEQGLLAKEYFKSFGEVATLGDISQRTREIQEQVNRIADKYLKMPDDTFQEG